MDKVTNLVSIIIVNYNTFDLTEACIRSIYQKTHNCNFEIILVDNASSECDPQRFKDQFPFIILVVSKKNIGFAGGNNLGIQQANGDQILLLNSDIELINDAVSIASDLIRSNDKIGVLSGQLQFPDGRLQAVAGKFPSIKRQLLEFFRITKLFSSSFKSRYYLNQQWDHNLPVEADWVWGAFFMFRKDDLMSFPENKLHDTFFMYGEDMQWCYYFKKYLKKTIVYSPLPKCVHFIGGSDKDQHSIFNKYRIKILPNEYIWMISEFGLIYTRFYFLLKSLHLYSLLDYKKYKDAKLYLRVSFYGLPNS